MAKADDNSNIPFPDGDWWLLREVRDLVARFGKMENDAAGELALDYIRKHPPRWRWYQPDEGPGMRGIGPAHWGTVSRFYVYPVDFDNSRVMRIRRPPKDPYGLDAVLGEKLADFIDGPGPDTYQISQVCLHRDYVFAMLRAFGMLAPAQSPSPPTVAKNIEAQITDTSVSANVRNTCKDWVEKSVVDYPRKRMPPGWKGGYNAWLKSKAPKDWNVATIRNALAAAGLTPKTAHKRMHKKRTKPLSHLPTKP
jgi:hypothetical protein